LNLKSKIGLMTHLSDAEILTKPKNTQQLDLFSRIVDGFEGDISFAHSAAIMNMGEYQKTYKWNNKGNIWVRPGIALYGISPLRGISSEHLNLRAVMKFKSKLISIKKISKGESVGYNSTWTARNETKVGTVSVGYGDGYSRSFKSGTPVMINNQYIPLIGLVSMDLINIDLTDLSECSIGDEVILWGDGLPIEVIAEKSGLSAYSLATGITERVERSVKD
jgi:alanine racemase